MLSEFQLPDTGLYIGRKNIKGYIHIYTGDGKGKTSAAIGLLMRACGAGLRIYFCQFIKDKCSSEITILKKRFPEVTVKHFGLGRFIRKKPSIEDITIAEKGITELREAILSSKYDIIIADEINVAVNLRLFSIKEVLDLIDIKPDNIELIFTGRNAHKQIIERADLVTEMKKIKHYFDEKVPARTGIEL